VLKAVGKHCLTSMRSVDLISRFGGDEFIILLPETTIETARKAADRLQMKIASTRVKTKHGELSVTISMGIAQLTDNIPDLGTLIDRANQVEHKAKEKGDGSLLVFAEGLIGGLSKFSSRRRVPTRSASFRAEVSAEAVRG